MTEVPTRAGSAPTVGVNGERLWSSRLLELSA